MNYEFLYRDDFLIIRLSGTVRVNERLMAKKRLTPHLQRSDQKVIVDLEGLNDTEGVYILGVLNTIKKEFELLGGEVKLCGLNPELYRYFEDNRLDQIFEIGQSMGQIKLRFKEKSHGS
jgi:anti-anti-sigma factor